jgi:hypothetical protein
MKRWELQEHAAVAAAIANTAIQNDEKPGGTAVILVETKITETTTRKVQLALRPEQIWQCRG